jgi:alkylation response protein AidB-like acyl-CoA dehydrogenase
VALLQEAPEAASLRSEARAWLEESFTAWKRDHGIEGDVRYDVEIGRSWQARLFEGGWGAPAWPAGYGGRGFGPVESTIWAEEKARVGANLPFNVPGFGMAGPTIISHGRDDQKERFLRPMLRGDEVWCQLFSEPGAGSDLASLSTRADRDGDDWVVTGQKVWSSGAHESDWGILLARCDFDVPKHKGLVYLLVDMRAPGIEVRPLRQMDGTAHFNEVFLEGVRVPHAHRLGEPGDGWKVAITTLMHERMSLGAATAGFALPFQRLTEIAWGGDEVARDRLVRVYTQNRILELLNARVIGKLGRGQIPDAEGSVMKLVLANLVSDSAELGEALLGADGLLAGDVIQQAFLGSRAFHIGGGTDEVQKNVIAERVLGLPREPQPDQELPFRETVRT